MAKKKPPPVFDDLAMMKDEDKWPMWPILPLKNRGRMEMGMPACRCLYAGQGAQLYDRGSREGELTPEVSPSMVFTSFEDLLAAGWEVD